MGDRAGRVSAPALAATAFVAVEDARAPRWEDALLWRIVATRRGVPIGQTWAPSPGRTRDPQRVLERLLTAARRRALALDALDEVRAGLGLSSPAPEPLSCTLVICTYGRPTVVVGALDAVARLDPPPDELIVVDNDPAGSDLRRLVEAARGQYVAEPRRGLDRARTKALEHASCDLVAFTDDDCVPPPGWLGRVSAAFRDPSIAAVTGPAFAFEMRTRSQLRFELEGGFTREFQATTWDLRMLSPLAAGRVGAGANMTFRRAALDRIGTPFPPELDAGTVTESGGDMYALYRLLAAGERVVHDPATYVRHRHREDPASLHRTFRGYGVGLSACLAKAVVEEHELGAPAVWMWVARQYARRLAERAVGRTGAVELRVAADYLDGGLRGAARWWRSRRAAGDTGTTAATTRRRAAGPDRAEPGPPTAPRALRVSVIVPTVGRPGVLSRVLAALPRTGDAEIVVVDDSPGGQLGGTFAGADRVVSTGGRGAAAARNAGARVAAAPVLLFLDDDLVPRPGLLDAHLARHAAGDRLVVLGPSRPRPRSPGMAALVAALWWDQELELLATAAHVPFRGMLSGNMSIRREVFTGIGGFDERFARLRREDWLFGLAAHRAGLTITYAGDAVADHEFELSTGGRLRNAFLEGRGDRLLAEAHPEVAWALTDVNATASPRRRAAERLLCRPRGYRAALAAADALEAARLRGRWLALFGVLQDAAYAMGRSDPTALSALPAPVILEAGSGIVAAEPRGVHPPLEVCDDGTRLGVVTPPGGRWDAGVAATAAKMLADHRRRRAAGNDPRRRERSPVRGAAVVDLGTPTDAREWAALDRRAAECDAEVYVLTAPATRAEAGWVDDVAALIDGDRVAVAIGGCGGDREPVYRSSLLHRRRRYSLPAPPRYLAVRTAALRELGGFDVEAARHGFYGPVLDLAQKALDAGLVVIIADLTALAPATGATSPAQRVRWRWHRARSALLVRDGAWAELLRTAGVAGWHAAHGRRAGLTLAPLVAGVVASTGARREPGSP